MLHALLVELTSLWESPAAASKLGFAPVTQPAFPRLIPLSWWSPYLVCFVLDSVVLTSRGYLAMLVSLALLRLAPYL